MRFIIFILLAVFAPLSVAGSAHALDRKTIVQEIIQNSINNYAGNCPCPYNRDRAGRLCGRRSAYSKPGGASPICFDKDVTDGMIAAYEKGPKL